LIQLSTELQLRPATAADRPFLLRTFASTREDELAPVPWSPAQKAAFVEQQFNAQDEAYHGTYPHGEFLIVLSNRRPVGRVYVARLEDELRLIDITLLPAARGRGVGSAVLAWLLDRADQECLPVTLHVETWNAARRLYQRLGFDVVEQRGIYEFMRRPPATQLKTAS
jgi:ribosomal protein S18 acetylase RimI-like enzyme